MKRSHQNFVSCVILHLLVPLAPLLLEFIQNHDITRKSVILAGAMYSFSIGITSNQLVTFSICISIGFIMSGSYGTVSGTATALPFYNFCGAYAIILVFIINFIERFDRHVIRGETFILFK